MFASFEALSNGKHVTFTWSVLGIQVPVLRAMFTTHYFVTVTTAAL